MSKESSYLWWIGMYSKDNQTLQRNKNRQIFFYFLSQHNYQQMDNDGPNPGERSPENGQMIINIHQEIKIRIRQKNKNGDGNKNDDSGCVDKRNK